MSRLPRSSRPGVTACCLTLGLTLSTTARAQSPEGQAAKRNAGTPQGLVSPKSLEESKASKAPHETRFQVDPITDGAILSVSIGFTGLLEWIIGTGELQPQQPGDTDRLLPIDREVVELKPSSTANTISNIGALSSVAYAVGSTIEGGLHHGTQRGLVDLTLYAQTATLTWAVTDLAKIAVRRPRPSAYRERDRRLELGLDPDLSGTDNALSFFSGHASITASLATTATYLAFARGTLLRGYLTLVGGATLTGVVCWGRVHGGKHFPTDVIAGTMAGMGIGLLVPHLHRAEGEESPVWIGLAPVPGGQELSVSGAF